MSFDNPTLRCRNCKYWWPSPLENLAETQQADKYLRQHAIRGQCRRHAPPPGVDLEWTFVRADDWCGEHRHFNAGD